MAKENTHILFAHTLLPHFRETEILKVLSGHIDYYYLGSIIPDTFFYSSDESLELISRILHGKDGRATNEMIFKVLDGSTHMRDIAFILGYITHCALDITIHPVVYYLSGNYYDADPEKRSHAVYMHRLIETCWDVYLANPLKIYKLVSPKTIRNLSFERILCSDYALSSSDITSTLRKQIFLNRLFESSAAYRLVSMAEHCIKSRNTHEYLGLFYGHAASHGNCIPPNIMYRDIISGTGMTTTVKEVMDTARDRAISMMEAAYGYFRGEVPRHSLELAIPGESLDTGRLHTSPDHIRYTGPVT